MAYGFQKDRQRWRRAGYLKRISPGGAEEVEHLESDCPCLNKEAEKSSTWQTKNQYGVLSHNASVPSTEEMAASAPSPEGIKIIPTKPRRPWFDSLQVTQRNTWVYHDRERSLRSTRAAQSEAGRKSSGVSELSPEHKIAEVARDEWRRGTKKEGSTDHQLAVGAPPA